MNIENKNKGLYIHIPFCKYICTYCDFCKKFSKNYNHYEYIKRVIDEIEYKNIKDINSIYIGGGTPSVLEHVALIHLLEYLDEKFDNLIEYTIEVNPDDVNEEFVKILSNSKINRISVGVQTLNNDILNEIRRKYTKRDVERSIKLLAEYFTNISVDFMFNLPGQNQKDIDDSFEFLKKNQEAIKHVSYYSLIFEDNTILKNRDYEYMPEEEETKTYKKIVSKLKELEYIQYEISSFSKKGYNSYHNEIYWNDKEYFGVGLAGASYIENMRYTNTKSYVNYMKEFKNIDEINLSYKEKIEEKIFLGLRQTKGIEKEILYDYKIDYNFFEDIGLNIRIKPKYLFISNQLIVDLLIQLDERD